MMLGEVVSVKTGAVVGFGKLQPAGKQLAMRYAGIVQMIEHAEFHGRVSLVSFRAAGKRPRTGNHNHEWEGFGNWTG